MSFVLAVLLVLLFGYALMLVLANNSEAAVNLLFAQSPSMNLGLLLIVSLALGVAIGALLALVAFRVLPMKFEIGRLKKENDALQTKLSEANIVIEHSRKGHTLSETHAAALYAHAHNAPQSASDATQ